MEVEVKDPPKGMIPPGTQMVKPKAEPQPNKVSSTRGMHMHTPVKCMHACYPPPSNAPNVPSSILLKTNL